MNERIRELAEQAGIVNRKFSFGQWWETDLTPEQKNFAELIVRECALVVHKKTGPKSALNVLEHFGVEE